MQGELKICLSTLCVSDINDTSTLKLTIYLRCKDIKFEINQEFCSLILKQGTTISKICVYFICLLQKIIGIWTDGTRVVLNLEVTVSWFEKAISRN